MQKELWESCSSSFIFWQQPYSVDIAQSQLARDEYINRKLEREIVKSMKAELMQMKDINQRQRICITPVDEHGNLLKTKPRDWNKIKNKKFMIING